MPPSSADSSARGPRAPSPRANVLRGESEDVPVAPSSPPLPPAPAAAAAPIADRDRDVAGPSESSDESNGKGKRTAWSLPSNGEIDVGPVMGAVSWPALGESSKGITIKSASDGLSSSFTPPLVPVIASNNHNNHQTRVNTNNPNPNSNRPKPNKRGGGGSGSTSNQGAHFNGRPVSPPRPPDSSEMPHQTVPEKPAGNDQDSSPGDMHNSRNHITLDHGSSFKASIGGSPRSHGGSDHHRPLNRRGHNGGPNNGGRRDPDRMGYSNHSTDWNNHASRHIPPPSPPRLPHLRPHFTRPPPPPPPPGAVPFMGPLPPVRSFVGPPMGFPADIPSPVFYVPGPPSFIAPSVAHAMAPAMLLNHVDSLRPAVLNQIEYYFSNDNLCKDVYLRGHMDAHGWIPVKVIADFNRVKSLTGNVPDSIEFILDVVRSSELVEVQDEKIRRRHGWKTWVLSTSSPRSPPAAINSDSMVGCMQ